MSIEDRLDAAATKAENASEIMRKFSNDPAGTFIDTESGPTPSLKEWLQDKESTLSEYTDELRDDLLSEDAGKGVDLVRGAVQSLGGIVELVGKVGVSDDQTVTVSSFYADPDAEADSVYGGEAYTWKSGQPKSGHNGSTIVSPTVPWDGTPATLASYISAAGETDGLGFGCWVRFEQRVIDVNKYGVIADGTDRTAQIQAVINAFDGAGKSLLVVIADNIKFTLSALTHNATSALAVKYRFNDDLAFPNNAVGGSQQHMLYVDSGVSGISDNVMRYDSAPYHPAHILDMRSDINSLWRSAAQQRTSINGSYIISREGYTRLQLTYRDFDLDGSDNPDTDARKSGVDFGLWRAQWTITGITSASWVSPPAEGNLVKTADGRLFVVRFIDGAGMVLYHRKGNIQAGDALIFNGVTSSTTVTGTPARVLTSLLNRMCVSGYNGAVGFNMPPERIRNANVGIGGVLGVEKASGSLYGTSDPVLYCVDVLSAPTKGWYEKYNVTTGAFELYTHANVLMCAISPTGSMLLGGNIIPKVYSSAQLNDITHPVNTTNKVQGVEVTRISDTRPVYATGSAAAATWVFSDGTLAHTPV
jgi:hypothetical protein